MARLVIGRAAGSNHPVPPLWADMLLRLLFAQVAPFGDGLAPNGCAVRLTDDLLDVKSRQVSRHLLERTGGIYDPRRKTTEVVVITEFYPA